MKKNNLFRIGANLFGLFAVMAILSIFSSVLAVGATVTCAIVGAPISDGAVTMEGVRAGSADLDMNYVSKLITEMKPAATPLDTLMRNIRKQTTIKSMVSEYYAVDSRPLYDTVKTAYTKAGDGNASINLAVNNVSMWSADDTLMIDGQVGVDNKSLICFVISKNVGNNTILIQPLNGTDGANTTANSRIFPATISVNTLLTRLGPAKNELDAQTSPYAIVPVKAQNYLQIFMAQVEEGTYQRIHDKEVDWNFSDYEAQNIYDMKSVMEYSYLFGYKHLFTDLGDAGKQRYTTGGITRFITKGLEYGTGGTDRSIDNYTFVDWAKEIFTGNSGADTRILFGGNGLMANLSKVDTVIKQIEAQKTEVLYGITFNAIETNFGKLLFKRHSLFDLCGWGDNGIVLDLNNIERQVFAGRTLSARKLDLRAAGIRNVDAVVIEEASGVITRYPDTHAIISPKA